MKDINIKPHKTRKKHFKTQKSLIKCRTLSAKLFKNEISNTIWDVDKFCARSKKKKVAVVDFDGTLVSRYYRGNLSKIRPRPYLQEFLRRLTKKFAIIGYSAAEPERAAFILLRFLSPMVNFIMPRTWRKISNWYFSSKKNLQR